MAKRFKVISLSMLGGILGMMPFWRPEFRVEGAAPGIVMMMAGLAATLGLVAFMRRGGSPVKLMLGLAACCLALAYAGVV